MGEVRKYSCECGYEEELCTGAGMNAINIQLIQSVFPEESKELVEAQREDRVDTYLLDNEIAECKSCQKLYATGHLRYRLQGETEQEYHKPCPSCGTMGTVQPDIEHLHCPKCGKPLSYQVIGMWD